MSGTSELGEPASSPSHTLMRSSRCGKREPTDEDGRPALEDGFTTPGGVSGNDLSRGGLEAWEAPFLSSLFNQDGTSPEAEGAGGGAEEANAICSRRIGRAFAPPVPGADGGDVYWPAIT